MSIALRVRIGSNQMMSIEWAKLAETELLIIKMGRPFGAKSAANWVLKKYYYLALIKCRRMFSINSAND